MSIWISTVMRMLRISNRGFEILGEGWNDLYEGVGVHMGPGLSLWLDAETCTMNVKQGIIGFY